MRTRQGFTMVELMMAVSVCALALGIASKPAATYLDRSRTAKAAAVVAGDLDLARSMATRQGQPIRVAFDASAASYSIQSRDGSTVYKSVSLGAASDFKLRTAGFSPSVVDLYPTGIASSSLAVTLSSRNTTRTVTLSRVGRIRAS